MDIILYCSGMSMWILYYNVVECPCGYYIIILYCSGMSMWILYIIM